MLLIQLARAVTDARYWIHQSEMLQERLVMLNGQLKIAEKRSDGQASQDLARLRKAERRCERLLESLTEEHDQAIRTTETLVGRPLTNALRNALGDQPALRLRAIAEQVPANELRNRCDVQTAERTLQGSATSRSIPEVEWMSALALRGAIHPANENHSTPQPIDPMAIQLGKLGDFDVSMPNGNGNQTSQSTLARAMENYYSVVTDSAQNVQEILTRYVELRSDVDALSSRKVEIAEQLDALAEGYELGREDLDTFLQAHNDSVDDAMERHRLEHELARLAIDLFVAMGGPCRWQP